MPKRRSNLFPPITPPKAIVPDPAFDEAVAKALPPDDRKRRSVSKAEHERRHLLIQQMLIRGGTARQIEIACREQFHITAIRTQQIIARVRERWSADEHAERPHWKQEQMLRIRQAMRMALDGERDQDNPKRYVRKPDLNVYRQLESLLADIQGTKAAIKVDLNQNVNVALVQVMGSMTNDEVKALADEYDQLVAGEKPTIDVEGEAVPEDERGAA